MPITITVKDNTQILARSLENLWTLNKRLIHANRIAGRKSVKLVRGALLTSGIKWHRGGSLFKGVAAQNITPRGFDIFVPKIAVILHHGVRPHPILPRNADTILSLHKEGTIVFRRGVQKHFIRPHPWIERAVRNLSKMLGDSYKVEINRILQKVSK